MAKLKKSFNAKQISEENPFEPIPAGRYTAQVIKTELCETKAGDGHYLKIQFQVLNGEYKGRTIFSNLNIDNQNDLAVQIAEQKLSRLCLAVGVTVLKDTKQLHGKPLIANVSITEAKDGFEARNDIGGFTSLDDEDDDEQPKKKKRQAKKSKNKGVHIEHDDEDEDEEEDNDEDEDEEEDNDEDEDEDEEEDNDEDDDEEEDNDEEEEDEEEEEEEEEEEKPKKKRGRPSKKVTKQKEAKKTKKEDKKSKKGKKKKSNIPDWAK
jgi:cobalamin biosynthesis protein CobT